jgi:lipid-A-disaccharide synthase-like uncharacterized protein
VAAEITGLALATGGLGQACFFTRFLLQWLASERARACVVPRAFWWLSLGGAILVGLYALSRGELVLLVGLAVGAVIALRNLGLAGTRPSRRGELWIGALALGAIGVLLAIELSTSASLSEAKSLWTIVALCGQTLWVARFPLQWWASERRGASHFPASFWWTSLAGNALLLAYALHLRDPIFVLGFLPGPLLQVRNLMLVRGARTAAS